MASFLTFQGYVKKLLKGRRQKKLLFKLIFYLRKLTWHTNTSTLALKPSWSFIFIYLILVYFFGPLNDYLYLANLKYEPSRFVLKAKRFFTGLWWLHSALSSSIKACLTMSFKMKRNCEVFSKNSKPHFCVLILLQFFSIV